MSELDEYATLEGCCPGGVDIEMKNAVAIQRNAAAIAAIIKSLQKVQDDVEGLKGSIADPTALANIQSRLTDVETGLADVTSIVESLGGADGRISEIESTVESLSASVMGFDTRLNDTNSALVATQSNLAKLVTRVEALEDASDTGGGTIPAVLDDIVYRVAALETAVGDGGDISARITVLEEAIDDSDDGIATRITTLEHAVDETDEAIVEVGANVSTNRRDIDAVMNTVYRGSRVEIEASDGTVISVPVAADEPLYPEESDDASDSDAITGRTISLVEIDDAIKVIARKECSLEEGLADVADDVESLTKVVVGGSKRKMKSIEKQKSRRNINADTI